MKISKILRIIGLGILLIGLGVLGIGFAYFLIDVTF